MPTQHFNVATDSRRQIIDITSTVQQAVAESNIDEGLVVVSVPHCTCTVYVNENEAGLVADTLEIIDRLTTGGRWRHDRIDNNAEAHLAASIMGNAVCLPVSSGEVQLGTWQRIMLVELDGPRHRRVAVTIIPG